MNMMKMNTNTEYEPEPLAVTPAEAGEILGVSANAVWSLIRAEGFRVYHDGKHSVITIEDLQDWLAEKTGKPAELFHVSWSYDED